MATPELDPRHALTPSHPARPARSRRPGVAGWLRSGLLLGATATLTLTVLPGTAAADPEEAATADRAAQLVAEASHQLEVVTEQVNEAREILKQQQAEVEEAQQAAAEAREQLDSLDGRMREIARTAYTGDAMTELDLLLTSDSAEEFVSQLGTLDAIAGHTGDVLSEVASAAADAQAAQAEADRAAAEAQETLDEVTAKQADLEAQIEDYQAQYDALTAEQQRQANEAHAGEAVPAPAPSEAVPAPAPSEALAAPVDSSAPAPGGAAGVAVSTALAQVGDPYVWGAGGPDAFDCSGLMQYAYAAAGISLPHSSKMQSQMGTPVSRDQLQPGDLIFFYSPVSHVGMYIGNGQMVHASTSGTPVQVVNLDSMGSYTSARRVA